MCMLQWNFPEYQCSSCRLVASLVEAHSQLQNTKVIFILCASNVTSYTILVLLINNDPIMARANLAGLLHVNCFRPLFDGLLLIN